MEEALKEQEKQIAEEEHDARASLMFDVDTGFGDRFEAVLGDMLAGRHPSQASIPNPRSLEKPEDNEENATDQD